MGIGGGDRDGVEETEGGANVGRGQGRGGTGEGLEEVEFAGREVEGGVRERARTRAVEERWEMVVVGEGGRKERRVMTMGRDRREA